MTISPGLTVLAGCWMQSPNSRFQPGTSNNTGGTREITVSIVGGGGPGGRTSPWKKKDEIVCYLLPFFISFYFNFSYNETN